MKTASDPPSAVVVNCQALSVDEIRRFFLGEDIVSFQKKKKNVFTNLFPHKCTPPTSIPRDPEVAATLPGGPRNSRFG